MNTPMRLSPEEVHGSVQAGKALLVCAYDSDVKFRQMALESAIPYSEFESRKPYLPRDVGLIFY